MMAPLEAMIVYGKRNSEGSTEKERSVDQPHTPISFFNKPTCGTVCQLWSARAGPDQSEAAAPTTNENRHHHPYKLAEGNSASPSFHRERLPFLSICAFFWEIDQERSALSIEFRFTVRQIKVCLRQVDRICHFFRAMRLNLLHLVLVRVW